MGFRVLAVDDEPDVLGLVETKLQKAGFEVTTATNGLEAVERAVTEKPDVIIMDVMMPKLDGLSACTADQGPDGRIGAYHYSANGPRSGIRRG